MRGLLGQRHAKLAVLLGEVKAVGDPLVAYWEAQIARGEVPDLEMTVADLPESA